MASGFLGKSAPAANTWTNIYTVPSAKVASITINAVNQSVDPRYIDIAISTSSTSGGIVASEYIEYQSPITGLGSIIERTGLVTDETNGAYVWVRTSATTVAFQVYGYEE
jgi:hypothetical protein